jgi:hypothetical protein
MSNVLITGRRQLGKSTLAFDVGVRSGKMGVIFDPNAQYRNPELFFVTSDLEELIETIDGGSVSYMVYRPLGDVDEEFTALGEEMFTRSGFFFIVDEARLIKNNKQLDKMVRLLDTRNTVLIQNFHRPVDVAPACRALANQWYFFRTTLDADLAVVEELCGAEISERVKNLRGIPQGSNNEVLHWNDDIGTSEVIEARAWFRNISGEKETYGRTESESAAV